MYTLCAIQLSSKYTCSHVITEEINVALSKILTDMNNYLNCEKKEFMFSGDSMFPKLKQSAGQIHLNVFFSK